MNITNDEERYEAAKNLAILTSNTTLLTAKNILVSISALSSIMTTEEMKRNVRLLIVVFSNANVHLRRVFGQYRGFNFFKVCFI